MTRVLPYAAALLLAWTTGAPAQSDAGQAAKGAGTGAASSAATSKTPAPQGSAPPATTTPGQSRPQNTVGGAGVGAIVDGKPRVCVVEPKATTKTVYGSHCREYCAPRCSLWNRLCGHDSCASCIECNGCEQLCRRVLTKKTVPDCFAPACVLKEVPLCQASTALIAIPNGPIAPPPISPFPPKQ